MRIYLASREGQWKDVCPELPSLSEKIYVLGSFFYIRSLPDYLSVFKYCKDFMLDSGAFTFMNGGGGTPKWEQYVESYADFIKSNNVQKYFELDIDSVVDYLKVRELRRRLETLTGIPCIPVWHMSRGINEFERMCDEYSYVSVGGIVSKEIKPEQYGLFSVLIREAHRRNAKIHALGFTNLKLLSRYHFDSVDSSSWGFGTRRGNVYKFRNNLMLSVRANAKERARGVRTKTEGLNAYNFKQWVKFQKYADTHY